MTLLDQPGATEIAHLPRHLQLALLAIHTDTHFRLTVGRDPNTGRL